MLSDYRKYIVCNIYKKSPLGSLCVDKNVVDVPEMYFFAVYLNNYTNYYSFENS